MSYRLKLALASILTVGASAAHGANLLEIYEKAKQADPTIRQADANRLATRENKPQAWAVLLPLLTASGSGTRTNGETTSPNSRNFTDPVTGQIVPISGTSTTHATDKGYSITLSQTIFRWDQLVALKRADAQVAQAEATYLAAEQDLIVRVAQRYFAVLAAKDTVDS